MAGILRTGAPSMLTWYSGMFLGLSAVVSSALADPPAGGVEIWIRAFIPNPENAGTARNYVIPRPGAPGQSIVRLLPTDGLPDRATPACFVTDNRGFSSDGATTARLDTRFILAPTPNGGKVTPTTGRTTGGVTVEANCSTGVQVASAPGRVERDTIGSPAFADGTIQVIGQVQGKNELAGYGLAPSIDYSFDVRWSPWTGQLRAALTYGSFPAIEMYARVSGGTWRPVHRHLPTGTPWHLAGDAFGINSQRDDQTATLPTVDGAWRVTDPEQRFRLEISGGRATLVERNQQGTMLSRQVIVAPRPDGSLRLSRPNDSEVLTFLGFQPSLRAEIAARAPPASYIDLRFDGAGLRGDWYGLLVVKDNDAHLRELVPPGARPPRTFSFVR